MSAQRAMIFQNLFTQGFLVAALLEPCSMRAGSKFLLVPEALATASSIFVTVVDAKGDCHALKAEPLGSSTLDSISIQTTTLLCQTDHYTRELRGSSFWLSM